jgi:translation initiation factor IF-1
VSTKERYEAIVIAAQGNGFFKVRIEEKHDVLCKLSGKMRTKNIKVVEGDRVDVEVDTYDLTKGRIVFRKR